MNESLPLTGLEIAIIGMAGRFPGAKNLEEFWHNLSNGVESISHFTTEELEQAGVPFSNLEDPDYVKSKGIIDDAMGFDPLFFGYSAREAMLMDPQMRLYHECTWEALEDAGYCPDNNNALIGIYGGIGSNPYWTSQFVNNKQSAFDTAALYEIGNINSAEFYNTRIAYKLDLKGPAITVQTACSSSLVSVHLAVQGLLSGECDVALAGGVRLSANAQQSEPEKYGYFYQEGMILSPDGHCRSFDSNANGTVGGDGVGMVVLKRLEDAISERDQIYAVIKGSAINNDGKDKVGYTAPSVAGQSAVIEAALQLSEIDAETISYVETHGTGTNLGDPIEIEALNKAYHSHKLGFCKIGSVKSNLGHLDTAAGIAGLIKTVLALKNKKIPPSLHYTKPNPKINFEGTPFTVNSALCNWENQGYSLRAGVSSFGIGGTNAHVILEEFDSVPSSSSRRKSHLIALSGKTEQALKDATKQLEVYIANRPDISLADLSYTLLNGRKHFSYRSSLCASSMQSAVLQLEKMHDSLKTDPLDSQPRSVYFVFSGQGTQYVGMAKCLYQEDIFFHNLVDECMAIAHKHTNIQLIDILYPGVNNQSVAVDLMQDTSNTQILLFIIEYALAKYLINIGIKPKAMLGHSIGEYVAACVSEVMTVSHAIEIILVRGTLMGQTEEGAMLSIPLSAEELKPTLPVDITIAAYNSTESTVVSGNLLAIKNFENELIDKNIPHIRLKTKHGFHSHMMDPILESYEQALEPVVFSSPKIPYLSNYTGNWVDQEEIKNTHYWVQQLRYPVKFEQCLSHLLVDKNAIFIEIGPGNSLSTLISQHKSKMNEQQTVSTLPRENSKEQSDHQYFLQTLGTLFSLGQDIDWKFFYSLEERNRISLPTYPFQRESYKPDVRSYELLSDSEAMDKPTNTLGNSVSYFTPSWNRVNFSTESIISRENSDDLVFIDDSLLGERFLAEYQKINSQLTVVSKGEKYQRLVDSHYQINSKNKNDYGLLIQELIRLERIPKNIIHLWAVSDEGDNFTAEDTNRLLVDCFYSVIYLIQNLTESGIQDQIKMTLVSNNSQQVTGEEQITPVKASTYAAAKVIEQEYENFQCKLIDVHVPSKTKLGRYTIDSLIREIEQKNTDSMVALRGNFRWIRCFEKIRLQPSNVQKIRNNGVYLLTGGLGGIGLSLAKSLAKYNTHLILMSRSPFPERADWENLLSGTTLEDKIRKQILACVAIENSGSTIQVIQADVSNSAEVKKLISDILLRHSKLNGVFHLAGLPGGKAIQFKSKDEMDVIISAKILGTNNLYDSIRQIDYDFFSLSSSVTSILGGFGQIDYCAANAYLDAFAQCQSESSGNRIFSINWDVWREIGMAHDLVAKLEPAESNYTLLGKLLNDHDNQTVFQNQLSVTSHWALNEHRIATKATLPGTAYLEMIRQAVSTRHSPEEELIFQDVYFLAPFVLEEEQIALMQTEILAYKSHYEFLVKSKINESDKWSEHVKGRIKSKSKTNNVKKVDITFIMNKCNHSVYRDITDYRQLHVFANPDGELLNEKIASYGPRWNTVNQVYLGENQALAYLKLDDEYKSDLSAMHLHPSILDSATSSLRSFFVKGNYLPLFYKQLHMYHSLEAEVYSYVNVKEPINSEHGTVCMDVSIYNKSGDLLIEIEEFIMREVNAENLSFSQGVAKSTVIASDTTQVNSLEHKSLEEGLNTDQAVEAFFAILDSNLSSVVATRVTDFNLRVKLFDQLILQKSELNRSVSPILPRPDLTNAYVAAKSSDEIFIAKVWMELLGLDKVGMLDDFFELGGHSLLLMQCHKKLKDQFEKEITIVDLYKYTTISSLVSFINDTENHADDLLDEVEERARKSKKRKRKKRDTLS